MKKTVFGMTLLLGLLGATTAQAITAAQIVEKSFNHMRGDASVSTLTMTIYRPDWQRQMEMDAWTMGETESLIRIQAPAKDKGNGTLKKGSEMWTYNPKVNRTIKLPPSMMAQSWMGSDFSNNDLAKTDSLLHDYTHTLTASEQKDGHTVYQIESVPKPDAPVVWGLQRLTIRDDGVLLSQAFFDEDRQPVKAMVCSDIRQMDGRPFPMRWRMQKNDASDEYTEIVYQTIAFKASLKASIFTLASLKTRRR